MEDNNNVHSKFHLELPEGQMTEQHGMGVYTSKFHVEPSQGQMPQQLGHVDTNLIQYGQHAAINTSLPNNRPANTGYCYTVVGGQLKRVSPPDTFAGVQSSPLASAATAITASEPSQSVAPAAKHNGAYILRPRTLARWEKPKLPQEARETLVEAPPDIEKHRANIDDLLLSVYNNGLQTAGRAIFQRLVLEAQMTHSVLGLLLNPDDAQRTVSNIHSLSVMMSGMFSQPKDLTAETAEIWAEVEKARTAKLLTDPHAGGRTFHQNGYQITTDNPKTVTPSPAQKSNTKPNAKPAQKRSTKPIQRSGKASSSKANGKDARQFTLTGQKRTLVNSGRECTSYFCSDGQWRVLQDGPLEEAQRRTEALKASSGVQTKKTGLKRRNEAGDNRQTKKAKPKVQEITPPITATNSSSPGGRDLFTFPRESADQMFTPATTMENSSSPGNAAFAAGHLTFNSPVAVKNSPSPDGQSILTIPAVGDQIGTLPMVVNDLPFADGRNPVTVPANGNQIVAEAWYTQPSLTLQEAERNFASNYWMIANAPQDYFVLDVPPIPPVGDEEEFADLLWLGRQMNDIHSSFN